MESWRIVWRDGFAPLLSIEQLTGLADALRSDDPRLVQGATTSPPPLMCVQDFECEAACALGFCGVVKNGGFGVATVGEVEEEFARLCWEADQKLGEPAACRWLLNWHDDSPREEVRRELLVETERELSLRAAASATHNVTGGVVSAA